MASKNEKIIPLVQVGDEGEEEVGRKRKIHFKNRKEKTERKRGRN